MTTRKNLEIERLRAIAVLLTILVHAPFKQLFSPYLYSSFTGVDLFFVISGFVVTTSFLRTLPAKSGSSTLERLQNGKRAIAEFYVRRVFRIAPSAFFYIALYWLVAVIMAANGSIESYARPQDIFREGVAFAGGIYNYAMVYGGITSNLAHYYSLSIEEHFYLIAPVLLVLCGSTPRRLVAFGVGVALVLFVARPLTAASIANLSHTRFDELFYGAMLALLLPSYQRVLGSQTNWHKRAELPGFVLLALSPRLYPLTKTLIGLALCALLTLLPGVTNTKVLDGTSGQFYFSVSSAAFISYGAVSTVLVALASLERGWIVPVPGISTFLEYVGSRSYSLYLGHMLIIDVYNDLYFRLYEYVPDFFRLTRAGYALQFAAVLIASLCLAELSYRLVETPFRNIGRHVSRSWMQTPA
ncbi:acyltransferase family protein [Paraburkholderia phosphatilytica]|uniref:acyltransferase family protein n=1 Tax=Paraburkholderia phosphatilytica TaxID=2282883 RepID=UPI000E495512|nr:acyltransferase [Paraburkholderia phosphatilytica]